MYLYIHTEKVNMEGETHDHPKKDAYGRGLIHQKEHTQVLYRRENPPPKK